MKLHKICPYIDWLTANHVAFQTRLYMKKDSRTNIIQPFGS